MSSNHSTMKPMKVKTKRFKPKHQKAKLFRASEPLFSVFMWGINHTINELTHVNTPVMLMPDDFKAYTKVKIDNHCFNKENMPSHFKVKEYCPLVFQNLRERFHIDDVDYMNSLTKHQPREHLVSGKTSTKFYESYDRLFLLKILTTEEVESMHHLLKEYHPYIVERHGKTLLPQYLGMYRITVDGAETYICVMRNICSSQFINVHRIYDLKGSTVDREASEKDKTLDVPIYKDNDFTRDGVRIYADEEWKKKFFEMLEADTTFLMRKNIMDYSLCVAIHDCERAEQEAQQRQADGLTSQFSAEDEEAETSGDNCCQDQGPNSMLSPPDSPESQSQPKMSADSDNFLIYSSENAIDPSRDIYAVIATKESPRREIYFIGIVDILTQFGIRKRTALAAKTVKHGTTAEISTVHPEQYAKRFCEFITKVIQ
uniref:1-phosphatidylinositol-5-phosphate 4-kinase n=1 Tax=Dermatophagoides pteronyssinus TaxID=6956 RepID=A0A6P6Y7K9_DERPT|nr:phosphatidylinositol 5-phosphate 4-kinase type-2 alpha-like [Dermatophagoides pteronyssinus]XP_027200519.1 phosphatidylinositol 5-phosphate 4-kinase type-2 alpha-like [Dermatophagoides pteronyssinus]